MHILFSPAVSPLTLYFTQKKSLEFKNLCKSCLLQYFYSEKINKCKSIVEFWNESYFRILYRHYEEIVKNIPVN